MVGTISPVGNRTHDNQRGRIGLAALFLLGSTFGGGLLGLALGAVGDIAIPGHRYEVVAPTAVLAAIALVLASEAGLFRVGLPGLHRQVPAIWWRKYDQRLVALAWGLQLGAGVLTYVYWAGLYVVLLLALLVGNPLSVVILGMYGLMRGMQPMFAILAARVRGIQTHVLDYHVRSTPDWPRLRQLGLVGLLGLTAAQVAVVVL